MSSSTRFAVVIGVIFGGWLVTLHVGAVGTSSQALVALTFQVVVTVGALVWQWWSGNRALRRKYPEFFKSN